MKLRRGCGCPLIILGLADLLYLAAGVVSLIRHTTGALGSLFIILVGLGNGIVCVIVALAAIRGESLSGPVDAAPEGEDIEEGEGSADGDPTPNG